MSSLTYAQTGPPSHTKEGISIVNGMQTASIAAERGGTLERIAALAARLLELPISAVYLLGSGKPQLRASIGPLMECEWELRELVSHFRNELILGEPRVIPRDLLARRNGAVRVAVCVLIPNWEGTAIGVLVAAGVRWCDLANLAGNEIELDRRRNHTGQSLERRKTQEQLLEKTLELAKFGEDLRQLHRLSTTNHDSMEHLFNDYLETGRAILGMSCGVVVQVRGRYAVIRAICTIDPGSHRRSKSADNRSVPCLAVTRGDAAKRTSFPHSLTKILQYCLTLSLKF